MRTKTLILTAAVSAAGVATSMAQVFSVNAVGYVRTTVPANKLVLISNPLTAADNTINNLFKGAAPGTQVFKYNGTGFDIATYDDIDGAFTPGGSTTIVPGEGVFVKGTAADQTFTFVGEVPQGPLKNPLPQGLSIRSSQVPQKGTPTELGLTLTAGEQVFLWNTANQSYDISTFDDIDNALTPAPRALEVGEAMFIKKNAAGSWDRTFTVN